MQTVYTLGELPGTLNTDKTEHCLPCNSPFGFHIFIFISSSREPALGPGNLSDIIPPYRSIYVKTTDNSNKDDICRFIISQV